jgi:hypothetical protein
MPFTVMYCGHDRRCTVQHLAFGPWQKRVKRIAVDAYWHNKNQKINPSSLTVILY